MRLLILLFLLAPAYAQQLIITDPYLRINAQADDPLYTTYTAAMERSQLYGDKGYKMDYYSDCYPITYSGDQAGKMYCVWKVDQVVITSIGEYYKKPVVKASFPDMAIIEFEPFKGISVQETFFVYSSSVALVNLNITNKDNIKHAIEIYPVLEIGNDSLFIRSFHKEEGIKLNTSSGFQSAGFYGYTAEHRESKYRLISSLYKNAPYPEHCRNFFALSEAPYSYGGYSGSIEQFYNIIKTDYYSENRSDSLNLKPEGMVNFIALHSKMNLIPGEEKNIRYFREWTGVDRYTRHGLVMKLDSISLQPFIDENVKLFAGIPKINFTNEKEKLVYLSAFNLARGCMLPPEDSAKYNFYVFSRQPLWGWGHGHQVLHESLSMLAYVFLDPRSAQNSQRIYIDQQREDGLIAYRHGPRGMQDYPHFSKAAGKEMSTTSAPFFNWINLELFKVSKDKEFLNEAYTSGVKYVNWLIENRDLDKDGTYEWGPYGIIENVRDWYNAVFQVSAERYLDVDKEDISDELECLDLTLMMIKEMRSLASMASELNLVNEAEEWLRRAERTSTLVNERMWDEETEFYYSINKEDHSFKYLTRDLRRIEIIGFLALWAEAAPKDRAEKIIKHLLDENKFWRKYGVPTLAADDEWYSPYVDYCCKWNGPVWLLWNYMVINGLRNYGYIKIADELSDKLLLAVTTQLGKNHNFWESYSPDNEVLNSPSNYIWDAIIARVLIEKYSGIQ